MGHGPYDCNKHVNKNKSMKIKQRLAKVGGHWNCRKAIGRKTKRTTGNEVCPDSTSRAKIWRWLSL